MFAAMIESCRRSLRRRQSSLWGKLTGRDPLSDLGPLTSDHVRLSSDYRLLLKHGQVVWGAIAQANAALYAPGDADLPANIVVSPAPEFDANPGHLRMIGSRIWGLKGTRPADSARALIADIITDEHNHVVNEPLPHQLTDGYEAYLTSSVIHRVCLPERYLAGMLFPLLICPERTFTNLVLPIVFWPREMIEKFSELDNLALQVPRLAWGPGKPSGKPFPRDPQALPRSALRTDLTADVTPRAAAKLLEFAAQGGHVDPWFRIGIDGYSNYSLSIEDQYDPDGDVVVTTRGVRLVLAQEQQAELEGTVIDFRDGPQGTGFIFHRPSER